MNTTCKVLCGLIFDDDFLIIGANVQNEEVKNNMLFLDSFYAVLVIFYTLFSFMMFLEPSFYPVMGTDAPTTK